MAHLKINFTRVL